MTTREIILQSALELFHREGYENAAVRKIVGQSGVGKPTLYYYFGSKKGLLGALLQEFFADFWPELEKCCVYEHNITMNLRNIINCYFLFALKNPLFYQWYLNIINSPRESDPGELITPVQEKQWQKIEELFLQAVADHGNMRGRAKRYTFTFLGMINTYISTYFYGQIDLNQESVLMASHQFMHGIFS